MAEFMHDIKVDKISLVGSPANKRKFLVFKGKESVMSDKDTEAGGGTANNAVDKAVGKAGDNPKAGDNAKVGDKAANNPKAVDNPKAAGTGSESPTLESLAAQLRAEKSEREAMQKALKDAQEALAVEKDRRLTRKFDDVADGMPFLPMKKSDLSSFLKTSSSKLADDEFKQLTTMLQSTNDNLQESMLFKSVGSQAQQDGSPDATIMAQAKELVDKKVCPSMTEAIKRAARSNKQLYAQSTLSPESGRHPGARR